MALVAYSDSEGSDSEGPSPPPKQAPKPAPSAKSGFTKLVDRSNPTKIKVSLPSAAPKQKDDNDASTNRPIKRARTEGSGFNAMLPAPKRTGVIKGNTAGSASSGKRGLGRGLGAGVSLKTGAEPAFSRVRAEPEPDLFKTTASEDEVRPAAFHETQAETPVQAQTAASEAPKPRPMLFKPLSVMNKQKKKPLANKSPAPALSRPPPESAASNQTQPTTAPPKPKPSLFSFSASEDQIQIPQPTTYAPILHHAPAPAPQIDPTPSPSTDPPANTDSTNTLALLASDLNLPASARRQLLGRHAKDPSAAIPANAIKTFSMDAQYAENEAAIAAGETVGKAPVRAVAGGKHSLKQLVANANGQAEALEEQFAEGRRNRKEAGSKYGW
ncbi:hypothetical protein EJ05DRAFT_34219 [Pseudovirgaria hyperparasitica]|uniref:Uncharacterized protein n=1 Tax=Pseudovirgaria hyperparasitica TaxID=470096 RepID=A0A6A6WM92_9PEZI|nr:uncharacterized protein EJ05DRAFT_34219 [Pseudovirgaria hyperparasitica]KAF2763324.1 hypothetical protein EJ05DRAFT_34219 [Pseudovirgaria hyperparasitica]